MVYFHLAFIAVLRDCKNKDLQRMVKFPSTQWRSAMHSTNCTLGWPRGNGTYFLLFPETSPFQAFKCSDSGEPCEANRLPWNWNPTTFWREPKHGNRKRKWHFIIGNSRLALTYLLLSLLEGYDPFKRYPVISFLGQIVPINNQIVPQNNQFVLQRSQFIPLMLYLFSKGVNVIWVQSSDRNMDESIFRTIYIIVRRASYVNFTMHCGTMWELLLE